MKKARGRSHYQKMTAKMEAIRAVEDKYGLILFRTGLSHLINVGVCNLTDENVAEIIEQIKAQGEEDVRNGVKKIMTPEFECEIVYCAAELAKFSIWDLIKYIKKYVVAQ